MKTNLTNLLLGLACLCVAGPGLHAQSFKYVADVPFAFHVANTDVKPGEYVFERSFGSTVSWMRSVEGSPHLAVSSGPETLEQKAGVPRLVFRRQGNDYYLAQIWNAEGRGTIVPRSKSEMSIRETMAFNGRDVVTVYLASLR